jgi:hypothetical protein
MTTTEPGLRAAWAAWHADRSGSADAEAALVALQSRDGRLLLHFRDATSGISTYGGGRSLYLDSPRGAEEFGREGSAS